MKVSKDNFYSNELNKEYMSVRLYKSFLRCEAKTMAKIRNDWVEPFNLAFQIGDYVHSWNTGKLEEFKEKHPEIISSRGKTKGQLKKEFIIGAKMINTLEKDPLVSKFREGEKEVIMTAELFGVPWKCRIDILNYKRKTIVDLKTIKSMRESYWKKGIGSKQNFIEFYDYLVQLAVYCEIERLNRGGRAYYSPYIIAVSKEEVPDKAVISLGTDYIKDKLREVKMHMNRIKDVWKGKEKPYRCEECDYCKGTKQLKKSVYYKTL